jgi:hypothetical protein
MGTWNATILGNDTTNEIRDRFLELLDSGEKKGKIATIVLDEYQEVLLYERTNVWLGIAYTCWECNALTQKIINEINKIIESGEDIEYHLKLDGDEDFIIERQKELNNFIKQISIPPKKIRKREKNPLGKQEDTLYKSGMCFAYKNLFDQYIGIFITHSEHYLNEGKIVFSFMDFESKKLPALKMFENSKLYGLTKLGKEWGKYEYQGNVTDLHYKADDKEYFFENVPKIFAYIGQLKIPDHDKLINNFMGNFMFLNEPLKMIELIDTIRLFHKKEFKLSKINLSELLDKVT